MVVQVTLIDLLALFLADRGADAFDEDIIKSLRTLLKGDHGKLTPTKEEIALAREELQQIADQLPRAKAEGSTILLPTVAGEKGITSASAHELLSDPRKIENLVIWNKLKKALPELAGEGKTAAEGKSAAEEMAAALKRAAEYGFPEFGDLLKALRESGNSHVTKAAEELEKIITPSVTQSLSREHLLIGGAKDLLTFKRVDNSAIGIAAVGLLADAARVAIYQPKRDPEKTGKVVTVEDLETGEVQKDKVDVGIDPKWVRAGAEALLGLAGLAWAMNRAGTARVLG